MSPSSSQHMISPTWNTLTARRPNDSRQCRNRFDICFVECTAFLEYAAFIGIQCPFFQATRAEHRPLPSIVASRRNTSQVIFHRLIAKGPNPLAKEITSISSDDINGLTCTSLLRGGREASCFSVWLLSAQRSGER